MAAIHKYITIAVPPKGGIMGVIVSGLFPLLYRNVPPCSHVCLRQVSVLAPTGGVWQSMSIGVTASS